MGTEEQFFIKIYTHTRVRISSRNICPSVPTVPQKQPIPPLSLRYPSVNDRTEDQMDQMDQMF